MIGIILQIQHLKMELSLLKIVMDKNKEIMTEATEGVF